MQLFLHGSTFGRFVRSRLTPGPIRQLFLETGDRVLWEKEFSRLRLQLEMLSSDFARTTFLREYTGSLIAIGRPDADASSLLSSGSFESLDLAEIYPALKSHAVPAECGITSLFYIKLLRVSGFKAYQYSFGFTEKPYEHFIHSVGLVEIDFTGARRLIIQDPYCSLTYRNLQGDPIDFFEFLTAIKHRQYERIVMDSSSVMTSLVIPDIRAYFPSLSDACKAVMTEAFKSSDGSLKTKIPITRNYATLMQSPYHHVENAFVEALHQHGFDEPFLYAYTLRAANIAGERGRGDLQRRIDAVLR